MYYFFYYSLTFLFIRAKHNKIIYFTVIIFPFQMASSSLCTIGAQLEERCNKTTYTKDIGLISFNDFSESEQELLFLRTQIKEIKDICYHHQQIYLTRYVGFQKKCADPFNSHKKPCRGTFF